MLARKRSTRKEPVMSRSSRRGRKRGRRGYPGAGGRLQVVMYGRVSHCWRRGAPGGFGSQHQHMRAMVSAGGRPGGRPGEGRGRDVGPGQGSTLSAQQEPLSTFSWHTPTIVASSRLLVQLMEPSDCAKGVIAGPRGPPKDPTASAGERGGWPGGRRWSPRCGPPKATVRARPVCKNSSEGLELSRSSGKEDDGGGWLARPADGGWGKQTGEGERLQVRAVVEPGNWAEPTSTRSRPLVGVVASAAHWSKIPVGRRSIGGRAEH